MDVKIQMRVRKQVLTFIVLRDMQISILALSFANILRKKEVYLFVCVFG